MNLLNSHILVMEILSSEWMNQKPKKAIRTRQRLQCYLYWWTTLHIHGKKSSNKVENNIRRAEQKGIIFQTKICPCGLFLIILLLNFSQHIKPLRACLWILSRSSTQELSTICQGTYYCNYLYSSFFCLMYLPCPSIQESLNNFFLWNWTVDILTLQLVITVFQIRITDEKFEAIFNAIKMSW